MQKPHAEPGEVCPFNGNDVSKVCHKCPMFVQLRGTDPNTGKEVDHWMCAFAAMPMLAIENSQQSRQTGAAVESFRNEMTKQNVAMGGLMIQAMNRKDPKLIE